MSKIYGRPVATPINPNSFTPDVDKTLSKSGSAADAKVVGDALTYAGRNLVKTNDPVYSVGNAKANGKSVVLDYKKNTDTYFRIATTENLVEGEQYVLSFDCTGVPADTQGKKFEFMFGLSSEKSYVTLSNGRVVVPFKAGKYDNYGSVLFDDTASDSAGDRPTASIVGEGIILSNFSIEKGSFSAGYRHNEQEYDRLRIPVLTKTQKAEIQALLDKYHAAAKKTDASGKYTGPFRYDGETVQNDYANSRCWREYTYKDEKIHRFAMCCNTFCEAIWMGRDVSDFEGKTGDTYSNKITKAFDWGYMFNFNDRKTMAGVAERNDPNNPKNVTLYYGYNNPNGYNSTNYEFSYSVNSVYDPAIMDSAVESGKFAKKQWFSSLMTQADIARELYKMGCEIPFEELDVGDLIFTKPRYTLNSDYDTFRNHMWWKNISHVAIVYSKAADGRLTFMDCTNTIYERPLFKFSESGFGVFYTARTMNLTNNIVMCARHPAAWGKSNMANIDRIDYMPMCYQTGYSTGQAIPFTAGMAVEEGLWYVYDNQLGKALVTGKANVWKSCADEYVTSSDSPVLKDEYKDNYDAEKNGYFYIKYKNNG